PSENSEDQIIENNDNYGVVLEVKTVEQQREEHGRESYAQELDLLRIRSGMLRLVSSFIELFTKGTEEDFSAAGDLLSHWSNTFSSVRSKNHQPTSGKFLVNLLPSRLHLILRMPYEKVFRNFSDFLLLLWKGEKQDQIRSSSEQCVKDINEVFALIGSAINEYNKSGDLLWNRKRVHETVNCCVEILSLVLFVLTICYDKYSQAPASQSQRKPKKKDSDQNNHEPVVALMAEKNRLLLVADLLRALKNGLLECDTVLTSWELPLLSDSLAAALEQMSLGPKSESAVRLKLMECHSGEIKELKKLTKDKLRLINKSI
ncbi:phagocyte signaling-impaired protein-like, partial [Uranotaenia lowii]|uniref:phagocyte signaling-impaired protein-like n=1 Tax=Uranotaenia lowii TaxID=190385 RepID=UPI00247999CD